MKNIATVVSLLFLFACGVEDNPEYQKLKAENEKLLAEANESEAAIDSFVISFGEIQANLDTIKAKEDIITIKTSNGVEDAAMQKELIKEDIQLIYTLMQDNRKIIDNLNDQLKNSKGQSAKLTALIAELEKDVLRKDEEIESLKTELANMNIMVETLVADVDKLAIEGEEKSQLIKSQQNEMNTAFFVIGDDKDLKAKGVITKEGGFIGLGKADKLADDIDDKNFTRINILKTKAFPVGSKKIKLVTSHQSTSYKLIGNGTVDSLVIKDPYDFWKSSKYLVILKN